MKTRDNPMVCRKLIRKSCPFSRSGKSRLEAAGVAERIGRGLRVGVVPGRWGRARVGRGRANGGSLVSRRCGCQPLEQQFVGGTQVSAPTRKASSPGNRLHANTGRSPALFYLLFIYRNIAACRSYTFCARGWSHRSGQVLDDSGPFPTISALSPVAGTDIAGAGIARQSNPARSGSAAARGDRSRIDQAIVVPPSMTIVWPVIKAPAGEASSKAAPAISSGSPSRRSGVAASRAARRCGSS